MHLQQFAETVLFGGTLAEKLVRVESLEAPQNPANTSAAMLDRLNALQTPARETKLSRFEKVRFPSIQKLGDPNVRAQVLHFFANHELLALEIMAFTLLKFPDAPTAFQVGLARTIQEEQNHLRLYIQRMNELGMGFGDLPLNDYFWQVMKTMKSPYDFVTQMSLTFEQANLDFSLFYKNEIAKTGDEKTTAILERVYLEEIGHVKHGLKWFREWKPAGTSDWQAYKQALVFPLTPRRGKGLEFSAEARALAGFEPDFIREMEVTGESKGRPPVVFLWNPNCESEVARVAAGQSSGGYSPSAVELAWQTQLEHLPLFLAKDSDVVLADKKPPLEWLQQLHQVGFFIPEFWDKQKLSQLPHPKLGGVAPWGQSPVSHAAFSPILPRVIYKLTSQCEPHLYSKAFANRLRKKMAEEGVLQSAYFGETEQASVVCDSVEATNAHTLRLFEEGHTVLWKAPFGTSGRMAVHLKTPDEIKKEAFQGWLQKVLRAQKEIVIEPYFNRVMDFSIQMVVENDRVKILDVRPFVNNSRRNYKGTLLGPLKLWLTDKVQRFLHSQPGGAASLSPLEQLHTVAKFVGSHLQQKGYRGPAGIDAFLWKNQNGDFEFRPFAELNPRFTLGRVALELESRLSNGSPAAWMFFMPEDAKSPTALAEIQTFAKEHPPVLTDSGVIESGVLFTNPVNAGDPTLISMLVAGEACLKHPAVEFFTTHLPQDLVSLRLTGV